MIEPYRDRTVWIWVAECEIELTRTARHQGLLAGAGSARWKAALGRLHHAELIAVVPHGEASEQLAIVRTLAAAETVEMQVIVTDRDRLAGLDLGDAFGTELGLADDAKERDAEPEMGERGAPGRTRQAAGA